MHIGVACQMSQAKQKGKNIRMYAYICKLVVGIRTSVHLALRLVAHSTLLHPQSLPSEICKQFLHLWQGNDVCSAAKNFCTDLVLHYLLVGIDF